MSPPQAGDAPFAHVPRAWLEAAADSVETTRLRALVQEFAQPRSRIHHPEGMRAAEELVRGELEQAGWEVRRQPFSVARGLGIRDHGVFGRVRYRDLHGANLIATKAGPGPAAVVALAHLDAVRDSPGADDNAASVAALVEVARLLADEPLRRTVILGVTDFEEVGLFGARALVSTLSATRPVLVALNLETIACTDDRPGGQRLPAGIGLLYPRQVRALDARGRRGDFTALIHDRRGRGAAEVFATALGVLAGPHAALRLRAPAARGDIASTLMHVAPLLGHFARGDHAAFWAAGVPAVMVTDTANFRYRHYHGPEDTPEKLDYERLRALTAATAGTIRALAA